MHGDVFSTAVVNVVVSLEDSAGSVVDSRSASVPGGSTAFRLGPNPRFDVRFDVPDELMADGLWIRANAFNAGGTSIGTTREPVVPPRVAPV